MKVLEDYWVLKDEHTGLYLVQLAEKSVVSYFLHHSWKEAKRFTDSDSAQKLRADYMLGTKQPIWRGVKPHRITISID